MRVLVKRGSSLINDLRFEKGPIYIGRQRGSQVFLPDRSVSRQHAVILTNDEGVWLVQDLQSANRTLLNGKPVAKAAIHEGDIIAISDFSIEIHFEVESQVNSPEHPIDLNDTVMHEPSAMQTVYKSERQKVIHLAPTRLNDFYLLAIELCRVDDQEELLSKLIKLLMSQFDAYHVWAGLRETTQGPVTCHGGLARGGHQITLEQLFGKNFIRESLQKETYILLPNLADASNPSDTNIHTLEFLCSAMAVPISSPLGAYGVIYVDNGADQASFNYQDLDYLTLVSTLVAAIVEHIG